jgi:hypothetical protein
VLELQAEGNGGGGGGGGGGGAVVYPTQRFLVVACYRDASTCVTRPNCPIPVWPPIAWYLACGAAESFCAHAGKKTWRTESAVELASVCSL